MGGVLDEPVPQEEQHGLVPVRSGDAGAAELTGALQHILRQVAELELARGVPPVPCPRRGGGLHAIGPDGGAGFTLEDDQVLALAVEGVSVHSRLVGAREPFAKLDVEDGIAQPPDHGEVIVGACEPEPVGSKRHVRRRNQVLVIEQR